MVIGLLIGLSVGAAAVWIALRERVARGERAAADLSERERELATARAELDVERRASGERLETTLKAISAEALKQSNESFLALAETKLQGSIGPLRQSLEKVETQTRDLERARHGAYAALRTELASMREGQDRLRTETGNLVTALRTPHVRGRWGEMQLRRVVEAAGMMEHCDFVLQSTTRDGEGMLLRPDLIVNLPGGKHVVVDAKVPLSAYLDAFEAADDAQRTRHLGEHARQVRDHIVKLGAKGYQRQYESPDFVIMFVPDETFLRAATEQDRALIEDAWRLDVIPASPTNLFALLRTVAATWQQETVAQSAREVHALGQELYDRIGTMAGHLHALGRSLGSAVGNFNKTVGTLETRVLVTGRKLADHGIAGELVTLEPIEVQPRRLTAAELTEGDEPSPIRLDLGAA
jgi:DNA recombination protein RmuC